MKKTTPTLCALAWLALLVAVLYGRTASFEYTRTDDLSLVANRADFLSRAGNIPVAFRQCFFTSRRQSEGFYRPLVTTSLILDAQVNRMTPAGFHMTNTALHLVVCFLLYLLLTQLSFRMIPSLATASLFAVHPVNVQAVAWLPGRVDLLLALFSLLSIRLFLEFLERKTVPLLIGHLALLFCALLSKEAAVALPVICAGYSLLCRDAGKQELTKPLLAGWVVCLGLWLMVWTTVVTGTGAEWSSWFLALFKNLYMMFMHVGKVVVPVKLSVLAIPADTPWIPGAIALLAIVIAAAVLLKQPRQRRVFAWGLLWFIAVILPSLPVSHYLILESRLYLPTIGILIAFLVLAEALMHRRPQRGTAQVLLGAAVCVFALFAVMSFRYTSCFRDSAAFTLNAVENSPHSALAHMNRGVMHHRAGRHDEAERHYRIAMDLNSSQPTLANNLGALLMHQGQYPAAETLFREELAITPNSALAYHNLGLVLNQQQRTKEAKIAFEKALEIDPTNAAERINKVVIHLEQTGHPQIANWYRELVRGEEGL